MKITINTRDLAAAVAKAAQAAGKVSPTDTILIESKEKYAKIIGYDLEVGMIITLNADVAEPGSILLSAKRTSDIIKSMPGATTTISVDGKLRCKISSGNAQFSVIGQEPSNYPKLPSADECKSEIKLPAEAFCAMVRMVRHAVAKSDVKPVFRGIQITNTDNEIRCLATDGFRLACAKAHLPLNFLSEQYRIIVPERALSEACKIITQDDAELINMSFGKKHAIIACRNIIIVTRILSGDMPEFDSVVPKSENSTVIINAAGLVASVTRVGLLISDVTLSPVLVQVSDGTVQVSAASVIGSATDNIAANIIGENLKIGFNAAYLVDALKAIESDTIQIKMNGSQCPVVISAPGKDDIRCVICPVRLSK